VGQSDRRIDKKDQCPTCDGVGWTPSTSSAPQGNKWVVCRECIGTGRADHTGRKRKMPDGD
jgi:DnaJ-class molecular chaperone